MTYRTLFSRLIIIGFLTMVGYSLARSISHKSALGVVLAVVSLFASVYFIQLLSKAKHEAESETKEIP